jgi:glycosyltransferase involved in cell wall biosynthesis
VKFLIASTFVPLVEGGGRIIVRDLETMLTRAGHEVDVLWLPFWSRWDQMPEQMLALRLTDVWDSADRLIAIRTPAYLLRHPHKILWFIHHHRAAYDLWGTEYQDIPETPSGHRVRNAIIAADNEAFAESRRIFTNSRTVSDRLLRFNNVQSEVLYPPVRDPERFRRGRYGNYVVFLSRIARHKRQALAIEAMRHVRSSARLVIAGAPDEPELLTSLRDAVAAEPLAARVQLIPRWISEQEKRDLLAGARAAIYIPLDEDSYGYPSLEAFHSGKAVITCSDSGGTLELIEDGRHGFITAPEAEALAAAIDRLFLEDGLAQRLGDAARRRLEELDISWHRVVSLMLA